MHLSTLGLITPALATVGDVICAALIGGFVILPAAAPLAQAHAPRRTRRLDQPARRRRFHPSVSTSESASPASGCTRRLRFDVRMRIARGSLSAALWDIMESGLPVIAFLVAFNPIWGFSWYFNTENWASGFWDKVTAERTDPWRVAMTEAVEKAATAGIPPRRASSRVEPPAAPTDRDFSFIVIGDTGEGDASQLSLSRPADSSSASGPKSSSWSSPPT